ncbi:MAG: type II toxin-antitoxin system RelE/ParE family toxin [Actinomycetota bacterium]
MGDINVGWEIELHPEVSDWLLSLPDKDFGRAARYIDLLEAEGLALKEPYTRQLRGALRELRFELRDVTPRISYFNIAGQRLVLLTVFRKQGRREDSEIRRVGREMDRCKAEGHTTEED